MGRALAICSAVGAVLVVADAVPAPALEIPLPPFSSELSGAVKPKTLPRRAAAPIALAMHDGISSLDGSQPPALREVIVSFDRHGIVSATGLPLCRRSQLEDAGSEAATVCRNSIVGTGSARVAIGPRQAVIPIALTLFNGGVQGNATTIFIQTSATAATPDPVTIAVKLTKKRDKGPYGLMAAAKIPQLAGGRGSVLSFSLRVKRLFNYRGIEQSYASASCPRGRLLTQIDLTLTDGERLLGNVVRPCASAPAT